MSLFKNGVGRPSNETIKKRRIIYGVIALLIACLVGGGIFAVRNSSILAIDKNASREYRVNFYANGAKVSKSKVYCKPKAGVCEVTTPKITRSGYQIIGWGTNGTATNAVFQPGQVIKVYKNTSYYAITKKTYTATFNSNGLEYIEHKKLSCNVYNKNKSCTIILPKYEKQGVYNSYWSSVKLPSTNLTGKSWKSAYFNAVLDTYKLSSDKTFYPNFNSINYNGKKGTKTKYDKYRNFKIHSTENIGKTLFEFESGISVSFIDDYVKETKELYKQMPWLFSDGKVFGLTEKTFKNYSEKTLGFIKQSTAGYFVLDLGNGVSTLDRGLNSWDTIVQLARIWDNYYYNCIGKHIYDETDMNALFTKMLNSEKIFNDKEDWFESMVLNYYNHILGNSTGSTQNLINGKKMSYSEKRELKKLIEKYGNNTMKVINGETGY